MKTPTGGSERRRIGVAMRTKARLMGAAAPAEGLGYLLKRRLLGPPLVNEQLGEQRLSNLLALGVLSPDGISSSAYGPEEILIALLPLAGIAAFTLILPLTLVTLLVLTLVVLSYREVVMVYIRPGGSYVVTRENFGPRVAQVTAVALMIDYVVTVAVQISGGTAAVVSAFPAIGPYNREITIAVILAMCYGNLRGIREAGKSFAIPTYLFSGSVILMIVVGVIREATGSLHRIDPHAVHGAYHIGSGSASLISFAMIFTLLRAFANGGASLTGIEAVSDAVGAFRPPEGLNARRVLMAEGGILAFLIAGIAWLAHATYATPRVLGYPTVLAQETRLVFGTSIIGHALFFIVQAATALILYTGGNTSFNGFPFLASYVAGDSYLPRWLLKRGHRLVFSNAIIVLTVAAVALILLRGANVNNLVPLYAIGVFTAFAMAGFGMARYHRRHRERGWRRRMITNTSAGGLTAIVVLIFAVVKFREGAWIVIVGFAIGVPALIRLNREYRIEAKVLERIGSREQAPEPPTYSRRTVYVFVDTLDLATLAALRYARSLRPTALHAVHFVLDSVQADALRRDWVRANTGIALDFVDCPDRRLARAAAEMVSREASGASTGVTAVLPRRIYSAIARPLHDRTADKIAGMISEIPHAVATIVPFDARRRMRSLHQRGVAGQGAAVPDAAPEAPAGQPATAPGGRARPDSRTPAAEPGSTGQAAPGDAADGRPGPVPGPMAEEPVPDEPAQPDSDDYSRPAPPRGVSPIGSLTRSGRAMVEGRVRAVEIRPVPDSVLLACEIADSTGQLTVLFYGRSHIPGLVPGARARFRGPVGIRDGQAVMINPAYELLTRGTGDAPS